MTHATPHTSQVSWEAYARCYDALSALRPYAQMIERIASLVPKEAKTIIDLGCGTGTLLARLQKSHMAKLCGVDSSPQMLSIARTKLGSDVTISQLDLAHHETCHGVFDCVVSSNVLYTIPDPLSFLVSIRKIMHAKSTAVIVTPKAGYDNGLILKAHCGDLRDDAFWTDPHRNVRRERMLIREALGETSLASDMELVAHHNRAIAHTSTYHFFTEHHFLSLIEEAGLHLQLFENIYADQNFLAVLTRG